MIESTKKEPAIHASRDAAATAASADVASARERAPEPAPTGPVFDAALALLRQRAADDAPPIPSALPVHQPSTHAPPPEPIPARMLNEFVYCPRLFYYEHVEGVFVENADTLRGGAIHRHVDKGKGELPPVAPAPNDSSASPDAAAAPPGPAALSATGAAAEVIHSRSVTLGSERLGVVAKLDLIEVRGGIPSGGQGDLFAAREAVPVDYKAGAPRTGADANELWPTDRMQLGVQMLLLREHGYACTEGVIYYRATKQRVRLPFTAGLELWILEQTAAARDAMRGPIPPPLEGSPKCVRCSLAPVCLPDETRLLARSLQPDTSTDRGTSTHLHPNSLQPPDRPSPGNLEPDSLSPPTTPPRRLLTPRDDTRALYLNTPGLRVGRKDDTLTVKDGDKLLDEVRLADLHHVALFGNIQLSTQAIHALCDAEIPVTYFSGGGWFYGITRGHGLKNIFTRLEQFRLAVDPAAALRLARGFVHGKIRNHRTLLMRNHVEAPPPALARLRRAADDALAATSLEELLGIEGAAAAAYFEHFAGMLKANDDEPDEIPGAESPATARDRPFTFDFNGRHRRPPTDPVNALLSLAYSVLCKDCTIACLAVGFDPYVGFYHQPRFGRPALALDLMEEFRPLVAESAVLSAINTRVINPGDFVSAGQAVNLTPAGRKKFFQTYEQRMSHLLTHPVFDYKVSYRRALELQARLLARVLTGEIPEYIPLLTR